MEKTLTPDERIRRAEDIYYRRMQSIRRDSATVNVNNKKNYGLLKKILLQLLICIVIYSIFYLIKNTNYTFSQSVLTKTNEMLSYDINIQKLYNESLKYIENVNVFLKRKENVQEVEKVDENVIENSIQNEVESVTENIGGEDVIITEDATNLSQMEQDAKYIIENKSLIIPLKGTITSRYGIRNPTTKTVPKYHTGIDIAVNEGTKFIASMEGKVELVSGEGDYGNHIKITNGNVMTLYAHCKTIYLKEGENVYQGQEIGEVGSTGNVTGPHLHFEIRKDNRYVDPDLILEFN